MWRRGFGDPVGVGVEVHGGAAEEADEGEAGFGGQVDGEGGGGGDGGEDGDAGEDGFLGQFEGGAAGDHEDGGGQREAGGAEGPADDLVHRVVAADVFAGAEQGAVRGEEAGGVQAAGAVEYLL